MESKSTSQTKARMIVVTVFVIGFAAGALSLNLYQSLTGSDKKKDQPRGGTEFLLNRMNQRVGLSSEQQEQVRKILDETSEKYKALRTELEPKIKDFEPKFN